MNKSFGILAVLAALVCLALVWTSRPAGNDVDATRSRGSGSDSSIDRWSRSEEAADDPIPVSSIDGTPVEGDRTGIDGPAASASSAWEVEGRLVESSGAAGGGSNPPAAIMILSVWHGYGADGEPAGRFEATSNADGTCRWTLPHPGRSVTLVASARPAGPGASADVSFDESSPRVVANGDPAPQLYVRYQLADHWISGIVTSAADQTPIEGADVRFNSFSVTTDVNGAYRLRVPVSGYGSVIVRAEGFQRGGATPGRRVPGESQVIDIELEPLLEKPLRLYGFVRDESGQYISGAQVEATTAREAVETDSTGRYELAFDHVMYGSHLEIETTARGFAKSVEDIKAADLSEEGLELDITLERGRRLEGTIVDAEGEAIRGARVRLGAAMFVATPRTYSDDDGRFVFEDVGDGTYELGARKRGFSEGVREVAVSSREANETLVLDALVLERSMPVSGIVRDSAGDPVAGASIRWEATEEGISGAHRGAAKSDEAGRFRGELAPGIAHTFKVFGRGLAGSSTVVPAGASDVELTVDRSVRLRGRVVDAATGAPIEQFKVTIAPPDESAPGGWFSGMEISWVMGGRDFGSVDGTWSTTEMDPIRPGAVTKIGVAADGYEPFVLESYSVPARGEEREIECRLSRQ